MNLLSSLFLLVLPQFSNAWGTVGHEVIANVAWNLLKNETQAWVRDVLNITNDDTDQTPLGEVADWADRVRHFLPWSAPLHFIDVRDDLFSEGCHVNPHLNPGCRFMYERDCLNDACVAGAIVNYSQILLESHPPMTTTSLLLRGSHTQHHALKNIPKAKEALMFLTHFIGDIHQPLHCSRATDKGGNDFHVHFKLALATGKSRRDNDDDHPHPLGNHHHSWNLHSVWDTGLIDVALERDYNSSQPMMETALLNELIHSIDDDMLDYFKCGEGLGANRSCTTHWGQESWDAAIRFAYTLDDNRTDVTDGSTIDEDYYKTRWPIAKQRLLAGSARLAGTLEWITKFHDAKGGYGSVNDCGGDTSKLSAIFSLVSWNERWSMVSKFW